MSEGNFVKILAPLTDNACTSFSMIHASISTLMRNLKALQLNTKLSTANYDDVIEIDCN